MYITLYNYPQWFLATLENGRKHCSPANCHRSSSNDIFSINFGLKNYSHSHKVFLSFADVHGGPHERRLLNDLLEHYNTLERPVYNESEPLELLFGLTLQQIIDVVSHFKIRQTRLGTLWPTSSQMSTFNF